jgi:hypothetical protein
VRHTGAAQDCEYDVAWANTYRVGIQYTTTATRCGNAVYNRHRAPQSRLLRALAGVPSVRAAAFRQSATEVGVEGLAAVATSTTTQTTLSGLAFNGLDGITPTSRGLLCEAQKGFAFVVDCTQAREFALASAPSRASGRRTGPRSSRRPRGTEARPLPPDGSAAGDHRPRPAAVGALLERGWGFGTGRGALGGGRAGRSRSLGSIATG